MKQSALLSFLLGIFLPGLLAQSATAPLPDSLRLPTMFQHLFHENAPTMTIELDFEQLLREKEGNIYQPAKFQYLDKSGVQREVTVDVKPKGRSRRKICDIPPIKVRFPREFLVANGFQPIQALEMVVICKDEPGYEQYVLREYAAYRLYNILTDKSLRTQLVKLKFKTTDEQEKSAEGFAFFIEPFEEMAQRLHSQILKPTRISPKGLQPREFDVLSLFEFMIGNTDWYVYNRHNIAVAHIQGDSLPIGVPYDFDYSGFAHTSYSLPAERLKISNVTTRYFLGLCRRPEDWEPTLKLFQSKKPELIGFCKQFPHFDKESRQYTTGYLEDFFDLLDNPKKVEEQIVEHCGAAFIK